MTAGLPSPRCRRDPIPAPHCADEHNYTNQDRRSTARTAALASSAPIREPYRFAAQRTRHTIFKDINSYRIPLPTTPIDRGHTKVWLAAAPLLSDP